MLELRNICFGYDRNTVDVDSQLIDSNIDDLPLLNRCNINVREGQVVSLIGANGCGKSTLGKIACGMLAPKSGSRFLDDMDVTQASSSQLCEYIAYVGQDPYNQIVSTSIIDEVAFGPTNLGLSSDCVDRRVKHCLDLVGLAGMKDRRTTDLSGGQQQRLVLAGALAMNPRYLVFDEVTSQLDNSARTQFRVLTSQLASEGVGILAITHDALEILASDVVVVLDRGTSCWSGTPQELICDHKDIFDRLIYQTAYTRLICDLVANEGYELSLGIEPEDLSSWIRQKHLDIEWSKFKFVGKTNSDDSLIAQSLVAQSLSFSYDEIDVVEEVSLTVEPGQIVLLGGKTGSGKSTLARLMSGLYTPDEGSVYINGKRCETYRQNRSKGSFIQRFLSRNASDGGCSYIGPGMVGLSFQRPEDQLFLDTVEAEIGFAPRNLGHSEAVVASETDKATSLVGLDHTLLNAYPLNLSGGQARRVAIASILSLDAHAYIFDEPTAGLDKDGRQQLHKLVRKLAASGHPVVVITHDVEEWLEIATRIALMKDGRIVIDVPLNEVGFDLEPFECAAIVPPAISTVAHLVASSTDDVLSGDDIEM